MNLYTSSSQPNIYMDTILSVVQRASPIQLSVFSSKTLIWLFSLMKEDIFDFIINPHQEWKIEWLRSMNANTTRRCHERIRGRTSKQRGSWVSIYSVEWQDVMKMSMENPLLERHMREIRVVDVISPRLSRVSLSVLVRLTMKFYVIYGMCGGVLALYVVLCIAFTYRRSKPTHTKT